MSERKRVYFNGYAMFFGVLYYIEEGLWKKGLILGSISLFISNTIRLLLPVSSPVYSGIFWILNIGMFGVMGAIDKERKDRFDETMWRELPSFFNQSWVVVGILLLVLGFTILFSISSI